MKTSSLAATQYRTAAGRLGWRLGSGQAQEHARLLGAPRLADKQVYAMARLSWKYEGAPALGSDRGERAYIECYASGYRTWHA
jgi:hypothetical protein